MTRLMREAFRRLDGQSQQGVFVLSQAMGGGKTHSLIAFGLLAVGWITFTAKALRKAALGDFVGHRNFMIRSYALTLSALTLRAWKWSITNTVELPPMDVYRAVAWLGWVPNILIAEFLIRRYDFVERLRAAEIIGRKVS